MLHKLPFLFVSISRDSVKWIISSNNTIYLQAIAIKRGEKNKTHIHANTNLVEGSKGLQCPGSSRAVPDGTLAVKLAKPISNTYERLNKELYVNRGKRVT